MNLHFLKFEDLRSALFILFVCCIAPREICWAIDDISSLAALTWQELFSLFKMLKELTIITQFSEQIDKIIHYYSSLNKITNENHYKKKMNIIEDLHILKDYAVNFESLYNMLGYINLKDDVCSEMEITDVITITSIYSAKDLSKQVVFPPDGIMGPLNPYSNFPLNKVPQIYSKAFSISTDLTYLVRPRKFGWFNSYEHECLRLAKENSLFDIIYVD